MFFETTITLPLTRLRGLHSLIEKVEIQAKEKNITEESILSARLALDMFPFVKQIQIATDNAKGMASRLARREAPKYEDNEATLADLKSRLSKTIEYLETFTPEDFRDAATAEARFPYFPNMKIVGADYVITYGLSNFFFHVVTAYDILRHMGFAIGKADFMAGEARFVPDAV